MLPRFAHISFVVFGFAAGVSAQPAEQPTSTTSGAPQRDRAVSSAVSNALSAGIKFNPPKPVEKPAGDVDLREVDKPRNEIVRLPKYVVEGERPPIFAERSLYSAKNLKRLAEARYMGGALNQFRLGSLTGKSTAELYSMQQYEDEERLKNLEDVDRHVYLYKQAGDDAKAAKAQKDSYSTFLRRNDDDTKALSKMAGQRY